MASGRGKGAEECVGGAVKEKSETRICAPREGGGEAT